MTPSRPLLASLPFSFALAFAPSLAAQTAMPGYSPDAARAERRAESEAIRRPDAARAGRYARDLSSTPHVAGTPAQARTRDYVLARLREWGLTPEVREYQVWLPQTRQLQVWRVAPDTLALDLAEGPVPGDSATWVGGEPVVANGFSGNGDVSAPVVYVNYGLIEDYARLDSLGVSVKGKVVLARYGRSYRGIKAREAERRGAAALLLFSDPRDDGWSRGDVYPDGPMRPPEGVQRGSVYNGWGDPTTPGYASRAGAPRVPIERTNVPRIPVAPISAQNAAELLRGVRGTEAPVDWQGALPFRYHVGPGPVAARVLVRSDTGAAAIKPIWNTFATIRGSEFPDELIVIGAHRDSWGPGAQDDISGTVSVLEAARTLAELARSGVRPKRTVVFATWDAEEWGLIGSAEYVEDDSLRLKRGAVAYLNQDEAASGTNFGAGGTPSLRPVLRDIARLVPDPAGTGSVYERWRASERSLPDSAEPEMGDPGGGSDFESFYNHLGIPHSEWGFGGPGGVYHSLYDTPEWMQRFGDPGYRYHATAARIGAALILRLANADILPYDYVEFARTMRGYLPALDSALARRGGRTTSAPLAAAIGRMERAASVFALARDSVLARGAPPRVVRERANAALLLVERSLTRSEGLRGRPQYRALIYAADIDNGYSTMVFPTVNEAVRSGDAALAARELTDLATRFDAATRALETATRALGGAEG